jgi:hypothetical protein
LKRTYNVDDDAREQLALLVLMWALLKIALDASNRLDRLICLTMLAIWLRDLCRDAVG